MDLNDRKIKILEAIITDYIAAAEPIGSRTIAKKYDLGISPATVRNEMSDLEEMGLLVQPHTSSGRIPSDKGYRLYVDKLMHRRVLTENEAEMLRRVIKNNVNRIDSLMEETARTISLLTRCTTVVTKQMPTDQNAEVIKHLQLVPVDVETIALVVVFNDKSVKNRIVRVSETPDYETLLILTAVLNSELSKISAKKLTKDIIGRIKDSFGKRGKNVFAPVMENILDLLNEETEYNVYTSGMKNLLSFPEFSDLDKARDLFQALEERDMLITLLDGKSGGDNIQIVIGAENDVSNMRDCSVIKTHYRINGRDSGSIGIIGPTRMDYPQVVSVLAAIVSNINNIVNDFRSGPL